MERSSGEEAYNIDLSEDNMLGEGTYGQVYKIYRKIDGQPFAAKVFKMLPNHMN